MQPRALTASGEVLSPAITVVLIAALRAHLLA
jgi:hypothetical protein